MLTPANIGQSIKMQLSPDALVLNGRDLEIKDQSGDKQFKIGTSGEVTARKVSVTTGIIPDYVFKEDYNLLTIDEVETFINEYGHLPKIKSATEYEAIGTVDLGELNLQLLEKVEELTLYTIEQQKQLELLKKELKNLSTKIKQNE